jgi:hypothetical protein
MLAPRQVFAKNGVGQQRGSRFHEEQYSRRVRWPADFVFRLRRLACGSFQPFGERDAEGCRSPGWN